MSDSTPAPLAYERSARRSLAPWGMFLVGGGFVFAGYTVDPLENCNTAGECAPWLVPVAAIMGLCFTAMGLGQLLANPRRGHRIDAATGDLLWWKNRTIRSPGDTGRIHPTRIASIRIDQRDDTSSVSLYDSDGERLHHFDEELVPWPYDRWAERLQHAWPHIRIDRLD